MAPQPLKMWMAHDPLGRAPCISRTAYIERNRSRALLLRYSRCILSAGVEVHANRSVAIDERLACVLVHDDHVRPAVAIHVGNFDVVNGILLERDAVRCRR